MKKIMSIVLTVLLLLALTACGAQKQEAQTLGGWTLTEDAALTQEAKDALEGALDLGKIEESGTIEDSQPEGRLLGGWQVDRETSLEVPDGVLHLASQTVAGTNHVVLCKGWSLCFVSADTQGKTEVVKSVPLDIAALSQPAEG